MMTMERKAIILGVCMGCVLNAFALLGHAEEKTTSSATLFLQANAAYEQAQYDEAARLYADILKTGVGSAALYFNSGNCYMKMGEEGRAILQYERALRLSPRDADILSNYQYAQSQCTEQAPEKEGTWVLEKIERFFRSYTINELTLALSGIYVIGLGLLVSIYRSKVSSGRRNLYGVLICVVGAGLVISSVLSKRVMELDKEAIVLGTEISATFEPLDQATTHFTLYEGSKVLVLQEKDSWAKVQRKDRKLGWIPKEHIERITHL